MERWIVTKQLARNCVLATAATYQQRLHWAALLREGLLHVSQQIVDLLTGFQSVGNSTAVTSCKVEISVWAEPDTAAVMTTRRPFENDLF